MDGVVNVVIVKIYWPAVCCFLSTSSFTTLGVEVTKFFFWLFRQQSAIVIEWWRRTLCYLSILLRAMPGLCFLQFFQYILCMVLNYKASLQVNKLFYFMSLVAIQDGLRDHTFSNVIISDSFSSGCWWVAVISWQTYWNKGMSTISRDERPQMVRWSNSLYFGFTHMYSVSLKHKATNAVSLAIIPRDLRKITPTHLRQPTRPGFETVISWTQSKDFTLPPDRSP